MLPEVILHIGMHKTGTTSIQAALNKFDNGKVRYAQLNDVNHSIPIYSLFSKQKYTCVIHSKVGRTPEEIDSINNNTVVDLERELSMGREKIIISGEDISTLEPDEVQLLVSWLRKRAKSLKVIAYVRDPLGFASSALQQYINGGKRNTGIPTPDYKKRFEAYTLCPEIDSIDFVEFKKNELVNGSVVADFCSRIGVDSNGLSDRRTNESMSFECAQLIYHLNKFGVQTRGNSALVKSRQLFSHFLNQNFKGDNYKIPKEWVWACMDMDDISWMEKVSGIQLSTSELGARNIDAADSLNELEETMGKISRPTLRKLQALVSDIDASVGRDSSVTNLINFLFASFYFKEIYTREKSVTLTAVPSRQEQLIAESPQDNNMGCLVESELREAREKLVALEQRGVVARLLNKSAKSA